MPTPVLSVRARAEHALLIRRLAQRLRSDPSLPGRLEAFLANRAAPTGTGGRHNFGPFADEGAALAFLRDRLVAGLDPLEIHLLGSRAHGGARPESDFDLLVVLPDWADLSYERVYAPVAGSGIGCDVVPARLADWLAEREVPGTLCFEAARGRLLYRKGGP